jgi:rare lipoprotein A
LAACSRGPEPRLSRPGEPRSQPLPRARLADASPPAARHGGYKLGAPYRVAGRWYFPAEDSRYDRRGIASWYGADFHGRRTANGEVFDMHALTAAHPTLPLPSLVYVTNLANGRTVLVRVNDRGPYVPGRIIDLSRAAARAIGAEASGVADVRVTWAGRAPLDGNDVAERRFLASQPWARDTRMGLGRW